MVNMSVLQIVGISATLLYIFVLPMGLHKGDTQDMEATIHRTKLQSAICNLQEH